MSEKDKKNQEDEGNVSVEELSDEEESNLFNEMFGNGNKADEASDDQDPDNEDDEDEPSSNDDEEDSDDNEGDEDSGDDEDNDGADDPKPDPAQDVRKLANLPVDQLYGVVDSIKDPTVKQQVQEIINRAERFRGSQSALTKKLQGYESTVSDLQAQIDDVKKQEPKQESGKKAKAPESVEALKAKYPQLAQAIEDTVSYQKELGGEGLSRDEVERMVQKQLEPVSQKYNEEARDAELQRLDDMASDLFDTPNTGIKASDIIMGEYSEDFKAWLSTQPPSVHALAQRATDADSAYPLILMYENAYQKRVAEMEAKEGKSDKQEKADQPNDESSKAREITKRREKKRVKAETPSSSSRGTPGESADSEEALFKSWFGKGGKYATKR